MCNPTVTPTTAPHLIAAQHPDGECSKIARVDELAQWGAGAPNRKVRPIALRNVALVDQPWDNMAVGDAEVVVRPIHVGRDDGREVAAVLLLVTPIHNVNHAFGVRVAFIGRVRRAAVNHGLINRVRRLIGEDARGQARNQLFHLSNHTINMRYFEEMGAENAGDNRKTRGKTGKPVLPTNLRRKCGSTP
jgi:hypothetical protein